MVWALDRYASVLGERQPYYVPHHFYRLITNTRKYKFFA